MAILRESPGFKVDSRVSIALDALDERQKLAVAGMITDRENFLHMTSDSRRVQRISRERPLYSLKAPSGLRIIYSQVGDEIVVMDLMKQATLDQYGLKRPKEKNSRTKRAQGVSNVKKPK